MIDRKGIASDDCHTPAIAEPFDQFLDQQRKVLRHEDISHELESQFAAQPIQRLDKLVLKPKRVERPSPTICAGSKGT